MFLLFKLIYTSTPHYADEFIHQYSKYCEDTIDCNTIDYDSQKFMFVNFENLSCCHYHAM